MGDDVRNSTCIFLSLFQCNLPIQAHIIKLNGHLLCLGLVVLLLPSFAYLLLSIKIDVLENGKTVQQKEMLASIGITINIVFFCSWK